MICLPCPSILRPLAAFACALLTACTTPGDVETQAPAADTSSGAASAAPQPAIVAPEAAPVPASAASGALPLTLEAAARRAGEKLFSDARSALGDAPRELVIDPLVDAQTGLQTVASVAMGAELTRLLADMTPTWKVVPLSRKALSQAPLLLIGTLSPVDLNQAGIAAAGSPDAFRILLALADLRNGRLVAKRLDHAALASVNPEPTRFFRESATGLKDRAVTAYVNSCRIDARIGDPLDPLYVMRLPAAAALNEAINAYNDEQFSLARRRFADAARLGDADDLRVLNGRYLTSWHLGRKTEASQAFARIVSSGLAEKRLALKVFFEPGTTTLLAVPDLRAQYRLWLREVARQTRAGKSCLRVIGHDSRTGTAASSESLSLQRAAAVRWILAKDAPSGAKRFSAEGVGWRENVVGLGTNDARDALDRRVEFRVVGCP